MKPDIHILAYNNADFTIKSVAKYRETGHEVVLWDNGSTKENREKVGEDPFLLDVDIDWNRSQKIGRGKNAQLHYAIANGDEWAVLVDNDTYLAVGWWDRMQEYIKVFPNVKLWGFFFCTNHRVASTETKEGLTIRRPSLLSGTGVLVNCDVALKYGLRWPEDPVDYSDHEYWADMGDFNGIDVEFQSRFVRAGFDVAIPEENFLTHMEQPGRFEGYR